MGSLRISALEMEDACPAVIRGGVRGRSKGKSYWYCTLSFFLPFSYCPLSLLTMQCCALAADDSVLTWEEPSVILHSCKAGAVQVQDLGSNGHTEFAHLVLLTWVHISSFVLPISWMGTSGCSYSSGAQVTQAVPWMLQCPVSVSVQQQDTSCSSAGSRQLSETYRKNRKEQDIFAT